MVIPLDLQHAFDRGENIMKILRSGELEGYNSSQAIELAYDLQAGTYYKEMKCDSSISSRKIHRAKLVAARILELLRPSTILNAGIGEATTLVGMSCTDLKDCKFHGFDISLSRVLYARKLLCDFDLGSQTNLCTGDLKHIPYADNSFDVVYTSHAIEPNGGCERKILGELMRVASEYLVLIEPDFIGACKAGQERMKDNGYCIDLHLCINELGLDLIEYRPLDDSMNQLNPSALYIIKKHNSSKIAEPMHACPIFQAPLNMIKGSLYSEQGQCIYPVIDGIPCLRPENAIICSKFSRHELD